jgi:hypothetical protein
LAASTKRAIKNRARSAIKLRAPAHQRVNQQLENHKRCNDDGNPDCGERQV